MGFLIKVLLVFAVIYMVINFLGRALFGTRQKPQSNPHSRHSQQQQNEPETQEARILDYQKKSFETTDAIDVEFEEIKQKERR